MQIIRVIFAKAYPVMKRIILLISFTVFTITAFAQRNPSNMDHENFFRVGVKGGVNLNKLNGKSYKQGFNYNFQAGAFVQFNFSRKLGLQPEINFVQNTAEFSEDGTDIYDDLFLDGHQKKSKLSYLEVPLLLNYNIGPSRRVKIQVGPSYGGLLKQTTDSLVAGTKLYKNGEWSAIGGLWIQLPLVNIGARYKLGLTNVNAVDDRQTWKNQAIQVFIGLTF